MLERVHLQESHNPNSARQSAQLMIQACEQRAAAQRAIPNVRSAALRPSLGGTPPTLGGNSPAVSNLGRAGGTR